MTDYSAFKSQLEARLESLLNRADVIEEDLRGSLDADLSEQAIDLADDEALEGVDDVLREEIQQVRFALSRIERGNYGTCAKCGDPISPERLKARPIATRCINCA